MAEAAAQQQAEEPISFTKFFLGFLGICILMAFLELTMKAKPISKDKPDYERAYELPPGLEDVEKVNGVWIHKKTGVAATKQEVETVGLVWAEDKKKDR